MYSVKKVMKELLYTDKFSLIKEEEYDGITYLSCKDIETEIEIMCTIYKEGCIDLELTFIKGESAVAIVSLSSSDKSIHIEWYSYRGKGTCLVVKYIVDALFRVWDDDIDVLVQSSDRYLSLHPDMYFSPGEDFIIQGFSILCKKR